MKRYHTIYLIILLGLFGCKETGKSNSEVINNKFSDFPYSHHYAVVMFNNDTVSFKFGKDKYPLSKTIDFSEPIDVKMYYPIKEYFVNGTNVLNGKRKMSLMLGIDTVVQETYNSKIDVILFNEELTVKNDTGNLTFDLNRTLDLTSIDSLSWRAAIYMADTGFIQYGKFYLKK